MIPINNVLYGINSEKIDLYKGLVAFFDFEENYLDSVNGLNGVESGTLSFVQGKISDYALKFGYNRYISLPNSTNFDFSDGISDNCFSISFWFQKNSGSDINILRKGNANLRQWELRYLHSDGGMEMILYSDSANYLRTIVNDTSINIINSHWFHFTLTYDGVQLTMYYDAILVNTEISETGNYGGMPVFNQNIYIQGMPVIDGLTIWKNKVLNQAEINALYNNGQGLAYPF